LTPLRNLRCPVCGAANECAAANTGSFDTPCWCANVTISQEALDRIPPDQRGRACLCPRCAGANHE
jgi:hypothetical protein